MDVKNVSLNGYIIEEIYVEESLGVENKDFPTHVFKLNKVVYDLKQAHRAGMIGLANFILVVALEKLT